MQTQMAEAAGRSPSASSPAHLHWHILGHPLGNILFDDKDDATDPCLSWEWVSQSLPSAFSLLYLDQCLVSQPKKGQHYGLCCPNYPN